MSPQRLEIASATPMPLRIGLGTVGAFIAIMVTKDLWRGVWSPSLLSPLFLLILGGGLGVGLTLVAAMIWGPDERWVIVPGRATVIRTLRRFRAETTFIAADVDHAEVVAVAWDSRPDSFELRLKLISGRTLRSPDFATHGAADSARRMLLGWRA